jgi:hypothetical protein
MRGVAERRVVRHLAQPERSPDLAPLGEQHDDAPVVGLEELLECQEREELRLK